MPADDQRYATSPFSRSMSEIAFSAFIGAALMLYVGFGMNLSGVSDSAFYNGSVAAFTWTMKIGGIAMGAVALLLWAGLRPALLVDAVLAAAIGAVLMGTGLVWMANGDMQGILNLVFGVLFLGAAKTSWQAHRFASGVQAGGFPVEAVDDLRREPAPTAPPATPPDPAAREAAIKRLMAAKRQEVTPDAPAREPGRAVPAEPLGPGPAARQAAVTPPEPSSAPEPPKPARRPPEEESPPDGFLSRLGRED